MRTRVTLPDGLFAAAEDLARRRGMDRSALYTEALAEYLARHPASDVTEAMNEVLSGLHGSEDEPLLRASRATVRRGTR